MLPLNPQRFLCDMKRQLKKPHDLLVKTGFLEKVECRRKGKEWFLYYYPGRRAKMEYEAAKSLNAQQLKLPLPLQNSGS